MAKLIALYNPPADPAVFQSYYHRTHVPLAKTIPGLRSLTLSEGEVQALSGSAPYLIAVLTFDSMADLQSALASPEGKATAADLENFASGGVTLLICETRSV